MDSGSLVNIMKDFGIDMKKLYIMVAISMALTGCASGPKMVDIPPSKGTVPEWFAAEPTKVENEIVVTATDTSKDMQFAIDKAMMNARVELANRIGVKIESLMRESLKEDSGGKMKDIDREVDRVSKQVTNQALSMYTRDKLVVTKEDGGYRAFVMLKMSADQGRKLFDGLRKNPKERDNQFKDLDEAINEKAKKI